MDKKIQRPLANCPVCSTHLRVSQLTCPECGLGILGSFESCPVCNLSPEMYELLMVFIKTRGSIKEMEHELGISYPTVRSRLDELQRALGFAAQESGTSPKEVLDLLEKGEITAEQAEEMLKSR